MSGTPAPRVVAAIVTAPLTIGLRAVENAPELVGRVRQELTLARFVGKMTVDQGRRELRRRLDGDPAASRSRSAAPSPQPEPRRRAPAGDDDASDVRVDRPADDVPDVEELALDDYDQLPAAQIVAKLGSLTGAERERIGRYEAAHRHRRTVLGKLQQLGS